MKSEEIKKRIYDRYPVTEKEKTCAMEKRKRKYLRAIMKNQMMNKKEKREFV